MIAKVAVAGTPFAVDKPYDYVVPEHLCGQTEPGMRVFVPFGAGNRVTEGIVLATAEESSYENCKEILRLADGEALLTADQLQLAFFMRERYFCTVYDAVRAMLPAGFWFDRAGNQRSRDRFREMVRLTVSSDEAMLLAKAKEKRAPKQAEILELLSSFGVLSVQDVLHFTASDRSTLNRLVQLELAELFQQEVLRRPEHGDVTPLPLPTLNEEQENAFRCLRRQHEENPSPVTLLSGITGSGKTSVYARLIATALQAGQGAILLVPEIALTPQMLALFSAWFEDEVAVLHSGLSSGERFDEWKRIRRGNAHLVVGTRSAVFAPVENLSLIIMDEEQEDSYASESSPRYHAREVARYRCHQHRAALVLGSATPDIRSRYSAERGEYGFFRLCSRYNAMPLPAVRIVDMKQELKQGNAGSLSTPLKDAILERMQRGEQSILFLNRRGTSKLVTCASCGHIYQCPHCSVSMTWHANRKRLICHYCGYSRYLDPRCPACGGELSFFGAGTQMVEEELHEAFPGVEIMRVDADTVQPLGSHRILFQRFIDERIPVMIGTQMVAKGLNFERVTLVGVLSADQSLYTNDFRAGEKTFSLLTQVIGRSGRSEKSGEAIIQTYTPDNEIIQLAARQDYEAFYRRELEMRRIQNAPPFCEWVAFSASGKDERALLQALHSCKTMLQKLLAGENGIQILGPVPMAVVRMNDRYRYRLQICCRLDKSIRRTLASVLTQCSRDRSMKNISFYIENEPGP